MLTIFSVPKPFNDRAGIIQRNAITSWTLLQPRPEIILFGNETGVAAICEELELRHEPEMARNEFQTPLLDGIFEKAQQRARFDLLCFVNADIILMSDFARAVERAKTLRRRFLMIGQRWDVDITERIDFENPPCEDELISRVRNTGRQRHVWAIDYFVFPRGLFVSIPPFALGRAAYDNWLLWYARRQRAALLDATQVVMAIHQNHDYSHIVQLEGEGRSDERSVLTGEEARRNRALRGSESHRYGIKHATHILTQTGIRSTFGLKYLRRRTRHWRHSIQDRARSLINRIADSE
jgi:hypothetical protein